MSFRKVLTQKELEAALEEAVDELERQGHEGNYDCLEYNCHNEVILTGIQQYVPLARYKNPKFPKWYSIELQNLTFEKKKAHKTYKETGSWDDYLHFSQLSTQCKRLSRTCYSDFIEETQREVPHNVKKFWNFINNKKKDNCLSNIMFLANDQANGAKVLQTCLEKTFNPFSKKAISTLVTNKLSLNMLDISNCTIELSDILKD
ncbi:hypothetical protein JTB14_009890 [Gonioctena quinquepunctata]|nr:hypothetical protein JTB14_009890 [Gonioctena quinquepunctata]